MERAETFERCTLIFRIGVGAEAARIPPEKRSNFLEFFTTYAMMTVRATTI